MTVDEFFAGFEASREIFDVLREQVAALGSVRLRATKSQIAFVRRTAFAWAWVPGRYLQGGHAFLVLSVALRRREPSARWKEVAEPTSGRFMHHLEVRSACELDDEVRSWLREAWDEAV